jgi:hypothetical protein
MANPKTLAELLRENLKDITPPEGYAELKERLSATKPTRERPLSVKVSRENIRRPGSASDE